MLRQLFLTKRKSECYHWPAFSSGLHVTHQSTKKPFPNQRSSKTVFLLRLDISTLKHHRGWSFTEVHMVHIFRLRVQDDLCCEVTAEPGPTLTIKRRRRGGGSELELSQEDSPDLSSPGLLGNGDPWWLSSAPSPSESLLFTQGLLLSSNYKLGQSGENGRSTMG